MINKSEWSISEDDYLSIDELLKIKALRANDERMYLVHLALVTGGRLTELLNLKWTDINEVHSTVSIIGIKGSKNRRLPIPRELMQNLLSLKGISDKVFSYGQRSVQLYWAKIAPLKSNGISKKVFHSLRHTFAVYLYDKTKDIMLVKDALGHVSIDNTMVYAKVLNFDKKLREALL